MIDIREHGGPFSGGKKIVGKTLTDAHIVSMPFTINRTLNIVNAAVGEEKIVTFLGNTTSGPGTLVDIATNTVTSTTSMSRAQAGYMLAGDHFIYVNGIGNGIVKLSKDGLSVLWSVVPYTSYNAQSNPFSRSRINIEDSNGNIFVNEFSSQALRKLSKVDGSTLAKSSPPMYIRDFIVDKERDVIYTVFDRVVSKFDTDLNLIWSVTVTNLFNDIALDPLTGACYVVTQGPSAFDATIAKVNPSGQIIYEYTNVGYYLSNAPMIFYVAAGVLYLYQSFSKAVHMFNTSDGSLLNSYTETENWSAIYKSAKGIAYVASGSSGKLKYVESRYLLTNDKGI